MTSPGKSQSSAETVLSQTDRTRIARLVSAEGQPLICKQGLGADGSRRIRHEVAVLERLVGVEGVPRIVAQHHGSSPDRLMLVDEQGISLEQGLPAGQVPRDELVGMALELARIVAAVHRRHVIHKDINPANILLAGPKARPVLIDFNVSSCSAEERPGFIHQSEIVGTLAYMAPEQTGRTGRSVDQRADLYSLGATLYWMSTGRPPFEGRDALDLIHAHLVKAPVPPASLNAALPAMWSAIVMRLLEKEADRRYQSADGLAHDLSQLAERLVRGDESTFELCTRDFAQRLSPPSRLVGRDTEIAALRDAFENALRGVGRGALVAGAPGVGKTALIAELRPIVTQRRGWFVSGKFDQTRCDVASSAVLLALRSLGRLLLSEPEDAIAALRNRLLTVLGGNTTLVAELLPEFGLLMDVQGDIASTDPMEIEARLFQSGLEVLRCVASTARPVVMVVDDLQWATHASVNFFNALLSDESLHGVLLIGAYREAEVDAAHPLTPMLARWSKLRMPPMRLRLDNLPATDLSQLVGEMLRLPAAHAAGLAEAVGARTGGNPYDTVELVNALRRDGALSLGETGWHWEASTIRRFIGQGDVVDLLSNRIDALPKAAQETLETMACLAGEADLDLLYCACGISLEVLESRLAPSLEDGLLVLEPSSRLGSPGTVRFRHDRVQQAAYGRLSTEARRDVHLKLARALAATPRFESVAAEQYLPVADAIAEPAECRRAIALLSQAARQALSINYVVAERLLGAAVKLLMPIATDGDKAELVSLQTMRATALYCMSRYDEFDTIYFEMEAMGEDPLAIVTVTRLRVTTLTLRGRPQEAVAMGRALLCRLSQHLLGHDGVPPADAWEKALQWSRTLDLDADLRRPDASDPYVCASGSILHALSVAAYFSDHQALEEVGFRACELWATYGPNPDMMVAMSLSSVTGIALRNDYRFGYDVCSHLLKVAEARQYEPHATLMRSGLGHFTMHWFQPVEAGLTQFQIARENALRAGVPLTGSFTYAGSIIILLECAPQIDVISAELLAAEMLATRVGNGYASAYYISYRQMLRVLRGESAQVGEFLDGAFDEPAYMAAAARHWAVKSIHHVNRAFVAAMFGDLDTLAEHSEIGLQMFRAQAGLRASTAFWLRALSLAEQAHRTPADERVALIAQMKECRDWFAARAEGAPMNFSHLKLWIDAEIDWAEGRVWDAAKAFDEALRQISQHQRPAQHAMLCERAGRFHLQSGLDAFGRQLMAEARQRFDNWGATSKVAQLDAAYPFLQAQIAHLRMATTANSTTMSADTLDMTAILRSSQALSSETNLERLKARISELLGALTGATHVSLVLQRGDSQDWFLEAAGAEPVAVEEAGAAGLMPLSAFRYVQRTREPLLVDNAPLDDRFALDPSILGLAHCSLLVVPILSQGDLRAVIVMENRHGRGAFASDRLDAVTLISGQLAVSLQNAALYDSLERKVAERTEALAEANQQLALLSITDSLTGLANRRRFNEVLDAEWKRAQRSGSALALAMIDIDQFKLYNDHYGHLGGDECLRQVGAALKHGMRTVADLAARYGGEEFVLVLPETRLDEAMVAAERLRRMVADLKLAHLPSTHGVVTISVGVVSFVPSAATTLERQLEIADAALYAAKHAGRNRVCGPQVLKRMA